MYERSYGPKYDAKLSTKDIAAKVRADIKAEVKAGTLPAAKYSVRMERFAGGSSIDVRISGVPFPIYNPERLAQELKTPHEFLPECHYPLYRPEAKALLKQVESMLQAYNHDGSDIQSDYFDVKFYGHADFDHDFERAAKLAEVAALSTEIDEDASVLARESNPAAPLVLVRAEQQTFIPPGGGMPPTAGVTVVSALPSVSEKSEQEAFLESLGVLS